MFTFFFLMLVGFGLMQLGKFAKNNPAATLKAASILKQAFGK